VTVAGEYLDDNLSCAGSFECSLPPRPRPLSEVVL
jgi:hypothetical protein